MKCEELLIKRIQETDVNAVELRMISSGNQLCVGLPLEYGLYFVGREYDDMLNAQKNAGIYSAIGGGSIPQADLKLYSIKIHLGKSLVGYRVIKQEEDGLENKKLVGFSRSIKGADRIAYGISHKTAIKLSESFGLNFIDRTPQDISEFSKYEEQLKLEERVYDYERRMGK